MNRCILSPTATKDLDAISDYFCDRNVDAGEKLFEQFVGKCENLIKFPAFLARSIRRLRVIFLVIKNIPRIQYCDRSTNCGTSKTRKCST
jgi:plasmid stabilization system protein ParE